MPLAERETDAMQAEDQDVRITRAVTGSRVAWSTSAKSQTRVCVLHTDRTPLPQAVLGFDEGEQLVNSTAMTDFKLYNHPRAVRDTTPALLRSLFNRIFPKEKKSGGPGVCMCAA